MKKTLAYEKIVEDWMSDAIGSDIMNLVADNSKKENESLPLRYRLIVLGLMKQDTLEDMNDNLLNHGCQPLYARSSHEATLIYAFANRLSYYEWRKLEEICRTVRDEWEKEGVGEIQFFKKGGITFGDLETYVLEYSEVTDERLVTKQVTKLMNDKIISLGPDYKSYVDFYASNLEQFSEVREKTRYYFCKYLYYYILNSIEEFIVRVSKKAKPEEEDYYVLHPLKASKKFKEKKIPVDDLMDFFRSCQVSLSLIYEELDYYYFNYISSDWVKILLEEIVDIDNLTEEQIKSIADYLKSNMSKKDKEISQDNISLVKSKMEQLNDWNYVNKKLKDGKDAIREYIYGVVDINRTTLISSLLFFSTSITNRDDIQITYERLNEILDECGYPMLGAKIKDDKKQIVFDKFVINYLKSKDPVSYLLEEMDKYKEKEESFVIYEMYKQSTSNAKDIRNHFKI